MKGSLKTISISVLMMCGFLPHAFCQLSEEKKDTTVFINQNAIEDKLGDYSRDTATEELTFLLRQNFTYGKIYFSGKGFRYVTVTAASSYAGIRSFLMRCRPGSVISFEYCVYKKPDGKKVGPISKSFTVK